MNEKTLKKFIKSDKKVLIKQGTYGWSAYYKTDYHFMIADSAGFAYRFCYKDPLTGKISWSQWKNCRYDKITAEDVNRLLSNLDKHI